MMENIWFIVVFGIGFLFGFLLVNMLMNMKQMDMAEEAERQRQAWRRSKGLKIK